METTTIITATGSKYLIHGGDMLTRLSEKAMVDGDGYNLDTQIVAEEMTNVAPIEVGRGLRCTVMGNPLHTSPIVSITHEAA
jgi:hypothetical protein